MIRELDVGGSERQVTEVAKSLVNSHFEPHMGCFRDQGILAKEVRAAGIPIVKFPVQSFARPSIFRASAAMGRYIRDQKIQIVHTFDAPANVFGVFSARMSGAPHVISSQRAYRHLTQGGLLKLLRFTDRLVDRIVVNCDALRKHLIDDEHVAPKLIRVCYNGLDTNRFGPGPRWRPAEVNDAQLVIGVACVLRPEKGLETLVEAFAKVAYLHPMSRLLIVGSGPLRERLVEKCRDCGVADQCTFVPAVGNVEQWLHAFDIFVLPSLSEALSNVLMEAMASGCAVIASRIGGNPELVLDGQTGLLFDAKNIDQLAAALRLLIENPELRLKFGAAAAERMKREFGRERATERIQSIYSELIT